MRHPALPDTYTPEQLGVWLRDTHVETREHIEENPLTPEDISNFEHKSSLATRAIYDLQEWLKMVQTAVKKGTPVNEDKERLPVNFTLSPTKGLDNLEENRKWAEKIIKDGFTTETTLLFGVAYPEEKKICFFDAAGVHFKQYDHNMTSEQMEKWDKPMLRVSGGTDAEDLFSRP